MCLRAFLYVNIASSFKLVIDIPEQIILFSSRLYGCEGLWEKLLRDWLSVSEVVTAKRCPFYCNNSCLATVPVLILFRLSLISYCVSDEDEVFRNRERFNSAEKTVRQDGDVSRKTVWKGPLGRRLRKMRWMTVMTVNGEQL